MRGMWPEILQKLAAAQVLRVKAIRPNCLADAERLFAEYDQGRFKVAGFFHELIMMNYGARRLTPDFIRGVYELCAAHDVPTVDDEIQSCLWHHDLFLFREYGIQPTMVAVGKGFPGGEYAASRLLCSAAMDSLPQFGALVTNGQEELASLAYLVTMEWATANAAVTRRVGDYFMERLHGLAVRHPAIIAGIEGRRHLAGVCFHDLATGQAVAGALNAQGIDISVQSYKAECPPAALLKLPLTAGEEVVDFLINRLATALKAVKAAPANRE
jgi:4-aminobutyrate aminotransferase-like enzyme